MMTQEIIFGNPFRNLVVLALFTVILYLHRIFGGWILSGKTSALSQSFVGLAINSAVVTIFVNFSGVLAKFSIHMFLIILIAINLFIFVKRKIAFTEIYSWKLRVNSHYLYLVLFPFLINLFNHKINSKIVNAHWAYFSSIPFEILDANYNSRLRIFDNYPEVWERYHFFQGSIHANLLQLIPHPNYSDYSLSKLFILTLFGILGVKGLLSFKGSRNRNLFCILIVFVLLVTTFRANLFWAIFSNNLIPSCCLIISLHFFRQRQYREALVYSLIAATSVSRLIVPVLFTISILLFRFYKFQILNFKKQSSNIPRSAANRLNLTPLFILLSAMFFTVFMGTSSSSALGNFTDLRSFVSGKLFSIWLRPMSSGAIRENVNTDNFDYLSVGNTFWFILFAILCLYVVRRNQTNRTTQIESFMFLILILALALFVIFSIIYKLNSSNVYFIGVYSLLGNYLLPFTLVWCLLGQLKSVVLPFLTGIVLQLLVLSPEIGFPSFYFIDFLLLYLFVVNFQYLEITKHLLRRSVSVVAILLFSTLQILPFRLFSADLRDPTTHKYLSESFVPVDIQPFACFRDDMSALFQALAGQRVTYDLNKSDRYSLTLDFISTSPNKNEKYLSGCKF